MELTPQKNDGLKVDSLGTAFICGCLFGVSGAVVSALLAVPLVRFVTYPLRKSATATTWSDLGPVQDFASLTAPIAKPLRWNVVTRGRPPHPRRRYTCCQPKDGQFRISVAHLSASGMLGPLGGR